MLLRKGLEGRERFLSCSATAALCGEETAAAAAAAAGSPFSRKSKLELDLRLRLSVTWTLMTLGSKGSRLSAKLSSSCE
jgi:hypothetical protein